MDKSVNHSPITKLLPLQKHHCSGVSEHKTVGWEVAPVFACYQDAKIKSEHRDRELWRVDKKTHYRVLRKVNLPCMCLWSCESLWKLSSFSLYPYPNLPGFAVGRHREKLECTKTIQFIQTSTLWTMVFILDNNVWNIEKSNNFPQHNFSFWQYSNKISHERECFMFSEFW